MSVEHPSFQKISRARFLAGLEHHPLHPDDFLHRGRLAGALRGLLTDPFRGEQQAAEMVPARIIDEPRWVIFSEGKFALVTLQYQVKLRRGISDNPKTQVFFDAKGKMFERDRFRIALASNMPMGYVADPEFLGEPEEEVLARLHPDELLQHKLEEDPGYITPPRSLFGRKNH